jgi:hypothetical protein
MDFEKIFKESLPVGERDAYNAWKKEQEEIAAHRPFARQAAVLERQKNKKAAEIANCLSNFFNNSDFRSDDNYVFANDYIARVNENKTISFYEGFFQWFKKYNIDCKPEDKNGSIKINLYGKREKIGPFYGKLKKLGLNVVREVGQTTNTHGFVTNHLSVTFSPEEFIEAVKKGLNIHDFEVAQWQ